MRLHPSLLVCVLWLAAFLAAQNESLNSNPALKPPKGAQVAIVVFEDLECPDCARAAPLLEEAARTYNIPVVRHDFPLAMHPWAMDAAILARYFRSEEHTSELQSQSNLVCRLLLEKKKNMILLSRLRSEHGRHTGENSIARA